MSDAVVRSLPLPCSAADAFAVFTARITEWWSRGYSASGENLARAVIEPRVGGRVYEVDTHGNEFDWGTVSVWEPSHRLVISWTLAIPNDATTEVEARFSGEGDACTLHFEHRGWGPELAAVRSKFDHDGGWTSVLAGYVRLLSSLKPNHPQ